MRAQSLVWWGTEQAQFIAAAKIDGGASIHEGKDIRPEHRRVVARPAHSLRGGSAARWVIYITRCDACL